MTSTVDILVSGPFARTMLTNFFFFASLKGFILLPLHIHQLGGNEAAIGVVQGMYTALTAVRAVAGTGRSIGRKPGRPVQPVGPQVAIMATP